MRKVTMMGALAMVATIVTTLFGFAGAASAAPTFIQGTLVDASKAPISGVTISATGPNNFAAQSISDGAGKWKIEVPAAEIGRAHV